MIAVPKKEKKYVILRDTNILKSLVNRLGLPESQGRGARRAP